MKNYKQWLRDYEDQLIDSWEEGFYPCGDVIKENSYQEFISNCWASFHSSQVDDLAPPAGYQNL